MSSMDHGLPLAVRRRRLVRGLLFGAAGVGAVALVVVGVPRLLRPTLDRELMRTARVERGVIETVIEASGVVAPASERVLTAAIDSRILDVLKQPGESVGIGEPIVRLDTVAATLTRSRLDDAVLAKRSAREQLRIANQRSVREVRTAVELKALDLEVVTRRLAREERLRSEGLASEESVGDAEVLVRRARIELARLEEAVASTRAEGVVLLEGSDREIQTLLRQSAEQQRELDLAEARAETAGVVTWVASDVGATVRRGDAIARIADLRAFRVEGSASDIHAVKLGSGLAARVVVDGVTLTGRVASVHPAIEGGAVRFAVELDAPSDPRLKNSRRVELQVVTASRASALKARGSAVTRGMGRPSVFVVRGDRALRVVVELGLHGFQDDEIVSGLEEGDEVVTSDLSDYRDLMEIRIR